MSEYVDRSPREREEWIARETCKAIRLVGDSIWPTGAPPMADATGNYVASLAESVIGITNALVDIANAIESLADAVENRK